MSRGNDYCKYTVKTKYKNHLNFDFEKVINIKLLTIKSNTISFINRA